MIELLHQIMRYVALVLEVTSVAVILFGFGWGLGRAGRYMLGGGGGRRAYFAVRRVFGKSLLLGLEILVAADLIRTVALEPTMANLTVFAFLVLIRTLLSWSLDVELEGVWPWQKRRIVDDEQLSGIHYDASL